MQGWDFDYDAIVVEEILDTDPDLYGRRALAAIEEERYYDAIQEAQTALKYSDGDIQYHFFVIKASYKMGMYGMCYNYILNTHILEYVYENSRRNFWTSTIEVDELMEIYMHCWRNGGHALQDARVIVVFTNDKGMVDTLQDAVNVCLPNQYIYIMTNINISGEDECECCIIEQGDIRIAGRRVCTNFVVNGGTVQFKSINIVPLIYKQAVEINGGKVSFIDVNISAYTGKKTCDYTVGIYVNNDASVMIKNCSLENLYVGIYARGGRICIFDSWITSIRNGIVSIGKDNKVEFDIKDCGFHCQDRALRMGYNSRTLLYRSNKGLNYGDVCIDGGGREDDNTGIIDIYDSTFFYIASYNKGIINLHNSEVDEIEAVNATVKCHECEPMSGRIRLRKNENGTIICNSKCSETTNVLNRGRIDYFVQEIEWIIRWSVYPLAESVKYVVESYETDRDKLNTKMKQRADILMKQLREAVVLNNTDKATKAKSELVDILFTV